MGTVGTDLPPAPVLKPPASDPRRRRVQVLRAALGLAVLGFVVAAAVDRRHQLAEAMHLLGGLDAGWLLVALAFELGSLAAFAALQRWLLSEGGVHVGLTSMLEITLAGNALAMSLPGGAAWSAAWAFGQLRRRGADRVLAAWVVLVAGALASFALFLLFVAGALIAGSRGPVASSRPVALALAAIPFAVAAVVVVDRRVVVVRRALGALWRFAARVPFGARVEDVARRLLARVRAVQPSPRAWLASFGFAVVNWVLTGACLVACVAAVRGHIPWRGILVAYALSQVVASVPITPGGIGVVEGSLTGLLVAYGMPTQVALAAVLLYRAISFWGLIPLGWASWAALALPARRNRPARVHPWALHPHHGRSDVSGAPLQIPDRVFPPAPCEGCPEEAPTRLPARR
jgi:uncharacterized protein (TIRG00374 family)